MDNNNGRKKLEESIEKFKHYVNVQRCKFILVFGKFGDL